jgi:predicted DsbA family dithiol-disulfide isomerase
MLDGQQQSRAVTGAIMDTQVIMNKLRSIAAKCATVLIFSALILTIWGPTRGVAAGYTDAQLIAFLQKRFRLPDASNITLGPPTKTPFPKVMSRTVTIGDGHGGSAKAMLFVQPGISDIIVGDLLNLNSDPWGRVDLQSMHLNDRPTLGPANAPITIVEFADFECPHCAHAMGIVETVVESKYNGKVRLVFKNFPLAGHQWAHAAAVASECVQMQNPAAFWDFARAIYRDQATISPDNLSQHIDDFAQHNQLDPEALHACIMGQGGDERVAQDVSDGQNAHVLSTPTLFINGIPVMGAEPEVLDYVIISELKKHRAS